MTTQPAGVPGGEQETEVVGQQHRDDSDGNSLNRLVMALLAVGMFLLLAYNIIIDSRSQPYEGYPVTLVLGGLLGGIIGVRRFIGGGDK